MVFRGVVACVFCIPAAVTRDGACAVAAGRQFPVACVVVEGMWVMRLLRGGALGVRCHGNLLGLPTLLGLPKVGAALVVQALVQESLQAEHEGYPGFEWKTHYEIQSVSFAQ